MRTLILTGSLALVVSACAGASLEQVGGALARVGAAAMPIGPAKEQEIGRGIAMVVAGRYKLLDDPELTRYVNLVGLAVGEQSVRDGEVTFRFGILDTDDVNAFAAPGGYILITRGALALMDDEAELAGVLAHEIGHVDGRHVLDEIRRADLLKTARDEAQVAGALLDKVAELGTGLLFTGLGREDELEADSLGLLYATASGYRPNGLLRFVQRLRELEGAGEGKLRELKATHPSAADRAAALERQITARRIEPTAGADVAARFRTAVGRQN